ncbi:glycogen synthase GlgA [Collinsella sp. AGMB00827]|uniref:Glycogen synthase n=1 Tax=Collinsella ureilytica TaxID=2869515 RepID=A0ABS7MHR6_9ACTN|nr:glycogen synthase GlgA [Collinsella urealyticum]MBY4796832.1 glycogen synthase GlgA [Collinsella urealyticum]
MAATHRKLGVVFASAEAAPFVKTGGLGDVAGSLPHALARAGANVIVMVPKYATIDSWWRDQMEHLCSFAVPLAWRSAYCGLERLEYNGVTYLFVDNEGYFARGYPYGFFDDGERFAFFSKAICEALQHLPDGFTCDILHCNDWHTALAPVFLREFYRDVPGMQDVKTVFSIHNIAFQGQFSDKILEDILGLAHIPAAASQLRCDADSINYMLGALNYVDAITTVSPTYAEEIKTAPFGEGLDGVLRRRGPILQGILNGIDTQAFNPATDTALASPFSIDDLSGKAISKARLQEELGLEVRDDLPLMAMVTRLTRQKGLDLVLYALDRILDGGVQVAILGTGDVDYENALRAFEARHPGRMAARIQFDPSLSQRMYAGSDLFLMPSLFEPCGLSQLIAMRYGSLPVVRETGGLKDTVTPYNYETGEGTGFSFANFNGDELGDAVFRGARLFWDDREAFVRVIKQAMSKDFSWTESANRYLDLYRYLRPEILPPEPEPAPARADESDKEDTSAVPSATDNRSSHAALADAQGGASEDTGTVDAVAEPASELADTKAAASAPAAPAIEATPAPEPESKQTATKQATKKSAARKATATPKKTASTAKKNDAKKTAQGAEKSSATRARKPAAKQKVTATDAPTDSPEAPAKAADAAATSPEVSPKPTKSTTKRASSKTTGRATAQKTAAKTSSVTKKATTSKKASAPVEQPAKTAEKTTASSTKQSATSTKQAVATSKPTAAPAKKASTGARATAKASSVSSKKKAQRSSSKKK